MSRNARLQVNELDQRSIPAVFEVSNLSESGAGSIRSAIDDANNNPGHDIVHIPSTLTGSVLLTTGPISINDSLLVQGPGTTSSPTFLLYTNYQGRALVVDAPTTLQGIAVSNSDADGSFPGLGGGIYSTASLTLIDCGFGGNVASSGGAIYQTGATLSLTRCSFSGGGAIQGGAIYASGTVVLQGCKFDSVTSGAAGAAGGAIYLASGSLSIDSSSFRGCATTNVNSTKGGAVYANGTFFAQNTTFASNGSNQGAAIYLTSGGTLWNCTVAMNNAGSGTGGGVHGSVMLESTIVSSNSAGTGPDIFGAVTAKNSAMGSMNGFSSFTDQCGNLAFGSELKMSMPGFYDGLTTSIPIDKTSPCKNAGSNPAGLQFDTRGPGLIRTAGAAPDIGAFEIQPPPQGTFYLNDGSAQRSRIIQLTVTLRRAVKAPGGFSNAFELKRASDNAIVTRDIPSLPVPPLTLTTKSLGYSFTGGPVDGNSLADGVYVWTVFSNMLVDESGQYFDGDGDGIEGGDYHSPTTPGDPNRIFRLFGDATGDGFVAANDFIIFRQFFNGVNDMFDFDQDGGVSSNDFGQFRLRFGGGI